MARIERLEPQRPDSTSEPPAADSIEEQPVENGAAKPSDGRSAVQAFATRQVAMPKHKQETRIYFERRRVSYRWQATFIEELYQSEDKMPDVISKFR